MRGVQGMMIAAGLGVVGAICNWFYISQQARDIMFWLLGSFGGVRWPDVQLVSVVVLIGFVLCLAHARVLDAFLEQV